MTESKTGRDALDQIKRLADVILQEVPGEPSQSEGAVDTAIRLIREYQRVRVEVPRTIRAELVCCDVFERDHGTARAGKTHAICFWGEASARLAEDVYGPVPVVEPPVQRVRGQQRRRQRIRQLCELPVGSGWCDLNIGHVGNCSAPTIWTAPFNAEQIGIINQYQRSGLFHPFTCGDNSDHVLVAVSHALICAHGCRYSQSWVPSLDGIKDAL